MTRSAERSSEAETGQILTIDQATALYPTEQLLIKVTAFDAKHNPTHGIIVAHSPRLSIVARKWSKALATRSPGDFFYLLQGGRYARTGEEMRIALAELARSGDRGGLRRW